jgi:hypothetical protein
MASIACQVIAIWSATDPEIDMSKPRLLLIRCSNDIGTGEKHRQRGRGFRPLVIEGGAQARSGPKESAWEAALELISLGVLTSQHNYLAFLQTGIKFLEAYNPADVEKADVEKEELD